MSQIVEVKSKVTLARSVDFYLPWNFPFSSIVVPFSFYYLFCTIFRLCFLSPCFPASLNPFPLLYWIFVELSRKPAAAQPVIPLFGTVLLFSSSSPNRCLIMLRHPLLRCASPLVPFDGPTVRCCLFPPAGPVNLTGGVKSDWKCGQKGWEKGRWGCKKQKGWRLYETGKEGRSEGREVGEEGI